MIIKGTAHWAKVVGAPGWGYKNQHKEWSIDVAIDEATRKALIAAGVDGSYIKNKGDDRADFLTFRRRELKADGTPGKPIAIVDGKGNEWDGKTLLGNGTIVNAKIALNEREGAKTFKPGLIKLQVVKLVEYEGRAGGDDEDFGTYNEAGEEEAWT